mmetsp:Transcript_36397/g.85096  ORF Transcript_36397/g.85096 Transcript_36397/m.85096 type:complete len:121 (+) Transcript_36397:128-490(+)
MTSATIEQRGGGLCGTVPKLCPGAVAPLTHAPSVPGSRGSKGAFHNGAAAPIPMSGPRVASRRPPGGSGGEDPLHALLSDWHEIPKGATRGPRSTLRTPPSHSARCCGGTTVGTAPRTRC